MIDLPLGKYTVKIRASSWTFIEYVTFSLTVLEYADAPLIEEEARNKLKPLFGEILLYLGYTKIL